ncbi:MAG: hypothetical protein R3352_05505 [Salinisphaeraceae bacterium]|nr:hypothetical protein [Salinisphaeraceae bacterium]
MNTATQTQGIEARLTTQEESGLKLWWKSGAPWVWLNASAVAVSIILVIGLLGLIAVRGLGHFWPNQVMLTTYNPPGQASQIVLGELVEAEDVSAVRLEAAGVEMTESKDFYVRYLIKAGNRDVTGADFVYVMKDWLGDVSHPQDILVVERLEWGNLYGTLSTVKEGDRVVASGENAWPAFQERLERSNELHERIRDIEKDKIGAVNYQYERLRLAVRRLELRFEDRGEDPELAKQTPEYAEIQEERAELAKRDDVLQAELVKL